MKFLLFLLGVIFFFIFFLFSKIQGVEGYFIKNIFLEANIYIIIVLFFVFLLSFGKVKKVPEGDQQDQEKEPLFSKEELIIFTKDFFARYIYYIALSIFYLALYLILHPLFPGINPDIFLLFLNILVLLLYFLEHKFEVFQDFIRVNLILGSLYYIGKHIFYILGLHEDVFFIDFINIICLFSLFFISFYSQRATKYKSLISHYFIAFIFLEVAVLFIYLFGGGSLLVGIISGWLGFLLLLFTDAIHFYSTIKKKLLREWGVVFLGIFTFISLFFISQGGILSYTLVLFLLLSWYILLLFHDRFLNYLAISISSISLSGALYGIYIFCFSSFGVASHMYIFFFVLAALFIGIDIFRKKRHKYDEYFYRMYSLLVNIMGIFCFFFFVDFSILSVGILLLVESVYLFFSYYSLSKTSSGR